ncbi:transcriptional corepressor LEUNIG-like protein isoform X3 [Iris pallida]|uniref:Transcriptional corepressor LEUNIG-like protein isoform X3 n=1 Tax=Iris pallida TaxID=29817 RepID=A0AAX6HSR0_IRIPA|nr:transcriptional corepressor LEUNIG-like protein isoform X3 [Iris pallida]
MALLKSVTNNPGQLVQGHLGNLSSGMQQIQARTQQTPDMKVDLGVSQRSLPMDPSSLYGQGIVQGKSALGVAGINQGGMPLKGWPLTGSIDQLRSSLSPQVQKPLGSPGNTFQLMTPHQQQQILARAHAQAQVQGSLGNPCGYGEMDLQRVRALPRGGLSGKDGQPSGNDGSIGSPVQSASPVIREDQTEYNMKINQMQLSSAQLLQEQLSQQHQLPQNNRKRKTTSSGAANSTGTGNTVGPSTSPPSTPSSNTPGDRVAMSGNLPHSGTMVKNSVMFTDASGGLASSSNHMDDMENFGDIGVLDENLDFFQDSDTSMFVPSKNGPAEHNMESSKGLTFMSKHTSNNKVLCCHFSSDGKILASAGHDKKVVIWNMENGETQNTPEEHTHIVKDIRFRPDSTQLATSSFDRTVRLWNATEPSFSLHTFTGHSSQVTSLDFHPKKTDLLCSCDDNGEIRVWNVGQPSGGLYSKGGSRQVRFQPGIGQFLAAAAENVVSIFDFESKRKAHTLKGHNKEVLSISWDANGEHLASISHDVVKVWSMASGDHIHELKSNGNNFYSCVFHPTFPKLLFIGGYQSMQLWNLSENKTVSIAAHEGLITSLAQAQSGSGSLIASASHDKSVKVWKYV